MDRQDEITDEILKEIATSNILLLKRAVGGIIISFVVTAELWQVAL